MLKNIYFHIEQDDTKQEAIEAGIVQKMAEQQHANLNFLQRHLPNIHDLVKLQRTSRSSILCNKLGELNIVDQQTGRVLYGLHPQKEIKEHVDHFLRYPLQINKNALSRSKQTDHLPSGLLGFETAVAQTMVQHSSPVKACDVVVVLGLGLGYHLDMLIDQARPKHVIIYEPDLSFVKCTLSSISWSKLFQKANDLGIGLYFQVGKDGRDLLSDLAELRGVYSFDSFFLYKHLNHPVFDSIQEALCDSGWVDTKAEDLTAKAKRSFSQYAPPWTLPYDPNRWQRANLDLVLFQKNLDAFEKYFPEIHSSMVNYRPKNWWPVRNKDGQINLVYRDTMCLLYGENPPKECTESVEAFKARPNRDGLVLGYKGKKLRNYLHYKFVNRCESVLNELEDSSGELPENVKSMILFGLGVGYQLEQIMEQHSVDKLFICEPNTDYFFASLFAINWHDIFQYIDSSGGHLYINIGDDGSNLIDDLLGQFHTVGPYILASTFFYQGYYNAHLVEAVARLREQLKVIIAMGDYYDHAKYGIAHTTWSVENHIAYMTKSGVQRLSNNVRSAPVILVGNGPSLDQSIEFLRSAQEKAIIVSCGTSLQTLYKSGIKPDFHAEVEQNRSTYEWAARVGAFDYLKEITLVSCNGIHPDTCGLYKRTFLAFKEGEASTVFYTEMFPEHDFELLSRAFPTVTNLASDIVSKMGFKSVYLVGVDLGFVDDKYHHSKASAYYNDDGEEMYEYAKENDVTILVEGNIRPFVYTKYEFKIAKAMLERTFSDVNDVYNLSDGVKFNFATTLPYEDVLFDKFDGTKHALLEELWSECFTKIDVSEFNEKRDKRFQKTSLLEELAILSGFLERADFDTKSSVVDFIDQHRKLLVKSYQRRKSFLFFYLNGTVNFVNSALSKVVNVEDGWLEAATDILQFWRETLDKITFQLTHDEMGFDFISAHTVERRRIVATRSSVLNPIQFTISSTEHEPLLKAALDYFALEADNHVANQVPYLIRFDSQYDSSHYERVCTIHTGSTEFDLDTLAENESLLVLPKDYLTEGAVSGANDYVRIRCAVFALFADTKIKVVFPKLAFDSERQDVKDYYNLDLLSHCYAYEIEHCVMFSLEPLSEDEKLTLAGDRLKMIPLLSERDLVYCDLPYDKQLEEKHYYTAMFAELRNDYGKL